MPLVQIYINYERKKRKWQPKDAFAVKKTNNAGKNRQRAPKAENAMPYSPKISFEANFEAFSTIFSQGRDA